MSRRKGISDWVEASVTAVWDLLQSVTLDPAPFLADQSLRKALSSQGALAAYVDTERGIRPSALNTLKAAADVAIKGGFAALDQSRLRARDALDGARAPKRGGDTKQGLSERVKALEQENLVLLQDLFLLQRAFDVRCAQARRYAEASKQPSVVELCRKEQREIEVGLSIRSRPQPTNIVAFRQHHDR